MKANKDFCRLLRIVAGQTSRRARTHAKVRSPLRSVTAGAFDRDVGAGFHGMPTSAEESAVRIGGPHQPAMATTRPFGETSSMSRALLVGRTSASPRDDRGGAPPPERWVTLSPVSLTTRTPSWVSARRASGVVALHRNQPMGMRPHACPSAAT